MSEIITCSVKEAMELIEHLDEEDMITLTIDDVKTHVHNKPKRISKRSSEKLIKTANSIEYQDNDFFGRFSLFGTTKDDNVVQNILFPQLE